MKVKFWMQRAYVEHKLVEMELPNYFVKRFCIEHEVTADKLTCHMISDKFVKLQLDSVIVDDIMSEDGWHPIVDEQPYNVVAELVRDNGTITRYLEEKEEGNKTVH